MSGLLTEQFQKFAGDNAEILKSITSSLSPIQSAGPSQFGFSPTEEAARRTGTAEQLNASGSQVANAVRSAIASKGGGTTYLPSGSEASILGSIAQDTAVKEAMAQSNITAEGYDIGRKNWEFATEGLMKAPGELESPVTSAGGAALGGAEAEMKGGTDITQANQAWMQPVGALVGGIINKAISAGTGGGKGGGGGFQDSGTGQPG